MVQTRQQQKEAREKPLIEARKTNLTQFKQDCTASKSTTPHALAVYIAVIISQFRVKSKPMGFGLTVQEILVLFVDVGRTPCQSLEQNKGLVASTYIPEVSHKPLKLLESFRARVAVRRPWQRRKRSVPGQRLRHGGCAIGSRARCRSRAAAVGARVVRPRNSVCLWRQRAARCGRRRKGRDQRSSHREGGDAWDRGERGRRRRLELLDDVD